MNSDTNGVRTVVISILSILVLFLIVLLIGTPITTLSNGTSFVYSVLVFVPVAIICVYAIVRGK